MEKKNPLLLILHPSIGLQCLQGPSFLFPPWFKQTHLQLLLVQFKKNFPSAFFFPSDECKEEFFRLPTAILCRVTESARAPFYSIILLAATNVSPFSLVAVVNPNGRLLTWRWGLLLATDQVTPMTLRSATFLFLWQGGSLLAVSPMAT